MGGGSCRCWWSDSDPSLRRMKASRTRRCGSMRAAPVRKRQAVLLSAAGRAMGPPTVDPGAQLTCGATEAQRSRPAAQNPSSYLRYPPLKTSAGWRRALGCSGTEGRRPTHSTSATPIPSAFSCGFAHLFCDLVRPSPLPHGQLQGVNTSFTLSSCAISLLYFTIISQCR